MLLNYTKILSSWFLEFGEIKNNILFYGSPERADFRIAIADKEGRIYVLEKINPQIIKRKEKIAQAIFLLKKENSGLPLVTYLLNNTNSFVTFVENNYWLLSPFVAGEVLDRHTYLDDGWRGDLMADFILDFKKTTDRSFPIPKNIFSLPKYVAEICIAMEKNNPIEKEILSPIINYLHQNFFPVYSKLPIAFCHGDYHPMNIIWGKKEIKGIIDWEFCGFKPEIYDLANMVGCLGMEHPKTLGKKIVLNLLQKIKQAKIYSPSSWQNFINTIIALRFAWLSEWLRKKDKEMIELETEYLFILLENKDNLENIWEIKKSP